jgi:hypothetical protein
MNIKKRASALTFLETNREHPQLLDGNYLYQHNVTKDGISYWRCKEARTALKCTAKCTTDDEHIDFITPPNLASHNHPCKTDDEIIMTEFRSTLKKRFILFFQFFINLNLKNLKNSFKNRVRVDSSSIGKQFTKELNKTCEKNGFQLDEVNALVIPKIKNIKQFLLKQHAQDDKHPKQVKDIDLTDYQYTSDKKRLTLYINL